MKQLSKLLLSIIFISILSGSRAIYSLFYETLTVFRHTMIYKIKLK